MPAATTSGVAASSVSSILRVILGLVLFSSTYPGDKIVAGRRFGAVGAVGTIACQKEPPVGRGSHQLLPAFSLVLHIDSVHRSRQVAFTIAYPHLVFEQRFVDRTLAPVCSKQALIQRRHVLVYFEAPGGSPACYSSYVKLVTSRYTLSPRMTLSTYCFYAHPGPEYLFVDSPFVFHSVKAVLLYVCRDCVHSCD